MPGRLTGHLEVSGNTLSLVVDSCTGPINWNTVTPNWVDATLAAATLLGGGGDLALGSVAGGSSGLDSSVADEYPNVGIRTNANLWFDWPGTASVTSTNITVNPANPTVFFRLRAP